MIHWTQATAFLACLMPILVSMSASQYIHPGSHALDLVITSTDSSLNPKVSRADTHPLDRYPVFSYLSISPNLAPPLHLLSALFNRPRLFPR